MVRLRTGPLEPHRVQVNTLDRGRDLWEVALGGRGLDPSLESTSPTVVEPTALRSLAVAPQRSQPRGTGQLEGMEVPGC